jgi:hydrogenase small subunit
LGLSKFDIGLVTEALANPLGPAVIWLHGSSCTGCSVSLLNRISDKVGEPATVADVLTGAIDLVFHPTIMALAGDSAVAAMKQVRSRGGYVLVLEGGVPTAYGGRCCLTYSYNGVEVTHEDVVKQYAERAAAVVCVGTCASFGGIAASGTNPTGVTRVSQVIGRPTINISGCPANPDWMVWAIVQLILGRPVTLDADSRPVDLYKRDLNGKQVSSFIHERCPLKETDEASRFGQSGRCLKKLGCRGPKTKARCHNCWNGIAGKGTWCIGVGAPCHGCTEATFPGPESFFREYG